MNPLSKTLFQSFVKPFYKENAGAFVFVFTMMFCIISKVDGAGLYAYHYSLATGILTNNTFLILVLFIWFLYVRKCAGFVSAIMLRPEYGFLQFYNQVPVLRRFRLLLVVESWLLLPVLLYALFMAFAGIRQHLYMPVLFIIVYLLMLLIIAVIWHVYRLNLLNNKYIFRLQQRLVNSASFSSYSLIIIRFIAGRQLLIWAGIKVFTCGVLYLIVRNNTNADYDVSMPFLFYSFGMLANGVLLFRIREFEEMFLSFYRGLAVTLTKRLWQYVLMYFLLMIPELITILLLTPDHLHIADAVNFALCGFSLLLLMNSIAFLDDFKMKDYIKILLALFFVECILLITTGFMVLYLLFFATAIILFRKRYYLFEQKI